MRLDDRDRLPLNGGRERCIIHDQSCQPRCARVYWSFISHVTFVKINLLHHLRYLKRIVTRSWLALSLTSKFTVVMACTFSLCYRRPRGDLNIDMHRKAYIYRCLSRLGSILNNNNSSYSSTGLDRSPGHHGHISLIE